MTERRAQKENNSSNWCNNFKTCYVLIEQFLSMPLFTNSSINYISPHPFKAILHQIITPPKKKQTKKNLFPIITRWSKHYFLYRSTGFLQVLIKPSVPKGKISFRLNKLFFFKYQKTRLSFPLLIKVYFFH